MRPSRSVLSRVVKWGRSRARCFCFLHWVKKEALSPLHEGSTVRVPWCNGLVEEKSLEGFGMEEEHVGLGFKMRLYPVLTRKVVGDFHGNFEGHAEVPISDLYANPPAGLVGENTFARGEVNRGESNAGKL